MTEKWTPGPWHYQEKSDAYTHIVRASRNKFLCSMAQDTSGEAEATARLIAAAPELFEALRSLLARVAVWERHGMIAPAPNSPTAKILRDARSALAKARGET